MSEVQVARHCHDGEEPECRQLLAMHAVRRDLERFAVAGAATQAMGAEMIRTDFIRDLHELIAALDRRIPQVERAGEAAIARDATVLRDKALQLLADLKASASPGPGDEGAPEPEVAIPRPEWM
jgi:hypothetical protein